MANEEQLAILRQGVEVWNKWREDNPNVEIDLALAYLSSTDLGGADLSEANLSGADLSSSYIDKANLRGANLIEARLNSSGMREASLSKANLRDANFNRANLNQADLREADLTRTSLIGTNLDGANLSGTFSRGANLEGAFCNGANLYKADLEGANCSGVTFHKADLSETNLNDADLEGADLREANLSKSLLFNTNLCKADLSIANLRRAKIYDTDFSQATLNQAIFEFARLADTNFAAVDLKEAIGLDKVYHRGPCTIGTNTLALSQGKIPDTFLRGCGLSDWEIQTTKLYNPDISNNEFIDIQNKIFDLRQHQAIQVAPLFISYSHADGEFIDKIGNTFTEKGVRYWRDVRDAKAGRLEKQIDKAISQNRTVLLVLSEHSIKSDWVEHEVRAARGLEKDMGRDVLCPIALDDSWKNSKWEKHVMEQVMKYNILDFSAWEDDVKFEGMFHKLIDGLELFYKDKSHGE